MLDEKLDGLIVQFKNTDEALVTEYRMARVIVDSHDGHANNPPSVPPTNPAVAKVA